MLHTLKTVRFFSPQPPPPPKEPISMLWGPISPLGMHGIGAWWVFVEWLKWMRRRASWRHTSYKLLSSAGEILSALPAPTLPTVVQVYTVKPCLVTTQYFSNSGFQLFFLTLIFFASQLLLLFWMPRFTLLPPFPYPQACFKTQIIQSCTMHPSSHKPSLSVYVSQTLEIRRSLWSNPCPVGAYRYMGIDKQDM